MPGSYQAEIVIGLLTMTLYKNPPICTSSVKHAFLAGHDVTCMYAFCDKASECKQRAESRSSHQGSAMTCAASPMGAHNPLHYCV